MTNPITPYCSSEKRSKGRTYVLIAIVAAVTMLLAGTSCADNETPFSNEPSDITDEIVFSVNSAADWQIGQATRTLLNKETLPALTLTSPGQQNLYLLPEIRDGIDSQTEFTPSTRSTLTTETSIESFGVFASLHPDGAASTTAFSPDYMYNVEILKDNAWAPTEEYLWPNKATLHFNAYSPYYGADLVNASGELTSLPSPDATGDLCISWSNPSDVADQIDLMWATPCDATTSPCPLSFNHALTAIKFVAGAELAPCIVKKIQITNVVSSGQLNLETGEWTLDDGNTSDYSVEPEISLEAASGSSFVAPGTEITSGSETLLMLPQQLSNSSGIILTIESNGSEYSFNATLEGQNWTPGKTVIYRLSANPVSASDSLILQVLDEDGNPVTTLESHYTGVPLNFSIVSREVSVNNGDTTIVNIPWKAEFVDAEGNVIDRPQWITSYDLEGSGDESFSEPTVMQEPVFATMSEDTRLLRSAADINASSGYTPYNLSNASGAPNVENTANCYVISAPGKYSIPLVYGNAVKNGATNEAAYHWSTHTRNVLQTFKNHLNNDITDPYIYNNAGCQPKDACIVWEGRLCLINNVALSDDGHSIIFEVPATYIRQGDALVAVRDNNGIIMWSWQIWVTPHQPSENTRTFTYNNHQYELMANNIGELSGGDDTFFNAESVYVRYTQVTDESVTPKSLVIKINRDDKHVVTPFTYSYFQWGRKDPIISLIQEWYQEDHTEITTLKTQAYSLRPTDVDFVTTCIRTPDTFWTSSHDALEPTYDYVNLWNVKSTDHNGVKSVYDPSPVGFMVPGNMMLAFTGNTYTHTFIGADTSYPRLSFTVDNGDVTFPLLGYRSSNDGKETVSMTFGPIWVNNASVKDGSLIPFQDIDFHTQTQARAMGFGIRPIKEP